MRIDSETTTQDAVSELERSSLISYSRTSDSSEFLVPLMESDYPSTPDSSDLLTHYSPDSTGIRGPFIESYYSPTSDFPAKEKQTDHIPEKQEAKSGTLKDATYKIKEIQYLGKKKHIVLQNENGPCPLIAICNILVLKNYTNLYPDTLEVSEEKLLHLVADALIDNNDDDEMLHLSSSLWDNYQEEYIANQKQKISAATNRLPCIADGINVNLKFRRIDDFVFTPELAIFGLLNIPLYHGWLVDPQDFETSIAIGCKSYNDLLTELVVLSETQTVKAPSGGISGECSVDFSAAVTASVGVPSPRLSKSRFFPDSPPPSAELINLRKGDSEEQIALLRALRLSEREALGFDTYRGSCNEGESLSGFLDENQMSEYNTLETSVDATAACTSILGSPNLMICQESKSDDQFFSMDSHDVTDCDVRNKINVVEEVRSKCSGALDHDQLSPTKLGDESVFDVETEKNSKTSDVHVTSSEASSEEKTDLESTKNCSTPEMPLKSEAVSFVNQDLSDRSQDDDIPLHETEGCISSNSPVYEGESLLGEYSSEKTDTNRLTPKEGEVITRFLKDSASQLTFHGLFSLVQGIQEGELCVFFRNNHFSTMLKYNNELYLLVTDQGYLTQRDVVWEKLDEVSGNSVFMTGDFRVFNSNDRRDTHEWDRFNAITNTADYISSINISSNEGLEIDPDLKMAMELQQQELGEVNDPYFT